MVECQPIVSGYFVVDSEFPLLGWDFEPDSLGTQVLFEFLHCIFAGKFDCPISLFYLNILHFVTELLPDRRLECPVVAVLAHNNGKLFFAGPIPERGVSHTKLKREFSKT
jgi:hypothetical protein